MSDEYTITYYCNNCRKDVDAVVSIWVESVSEIAGIVIVDGDAKCPNCNASFNPEIRSF